MNPNNCKSEAAISDLMDFSKPRFDIIPWSFVEYCQFNLLSSSDYKILDEFQSDLETNYGAGVDLVDFKSEPDPSREKINEWVADRTKQIIKVKKNISITSFYVVLLLYYWRVGFIFPRNDVDLVGVCPRSRPFQGQI